MLKRGGTWGAQLFRTRLLGATMHRLQIPQVTFKDGLDLPLRQLPAPDHLVAADEVMRLTGHRPIPDRGMQRSAPICQLNLPFRRRERGHDLFSASAAAEVYSRLVLLADVESPWLQHPGRKFDQLWRDSVNSHPFPLISRPSPKPSHWWQIRGGASPNSSHRSRSAASNA